MTDLAERRQLNRGHSDGFSRAVEIVATPVLFGLLGALLDGWAGTRPLLTLAFAVLGVSGIIVKLWLGYDREMSQHEARSVWGRPRRPVAEPARVPAEPAAEPIVFERPADDGPAPDPGGGPVP